ncbi:MAG: RNA-binding domain-containing protein, partial [Halopseudomonas sp.]
TRHLWHDLRWTITGIIICLIFLIVSLSQFQSDQTRREISILLTDKIAVRVQGQVSGYLNQIVSLLHIMKKWGDEGLIDVANPNNVIAKIRPVLEEYPNIAGLTVSNSALNQLSLLNTSQGWNIAQEPQLKAGWLEPVQAHQGQIVWLQVPRLSAVNNPTITGGISWSGEKTNSQGGVVVDILVSDFYDFIAAIEVESGGQVFLVGEEGRALIKSGQASISPASSDSDDDTLLEAAIKQGITDASIDTPLMVNVSGRRWWAGARPIDPKNPRHQLVVLIPEGEIVESFASPRFTLPIVAGALLLIGLSVILWQLKRYRLHLAEGSPWLNTGIDLQADLASQIAAGESAHQEFKSTIRKNLRSGKIGKEIEKAWLKGVVAFLNSEGGALFFGVDDDGNALGLDDDEFQSDDHCSRHIKSLITQHIGAEFATYTHFEQLPYQDKIIGVLACRPSTAPAFLKIGQDEEFYIRNGPASLGLSVSQTLAYLEQRN